MDNEKENERDTERETGNMSGEADEAARGVDFRNALGIRRLEAKDGHARCELPVLPSHYNVIDILHGGVLFTVADTTSGMAVLSLGGEKVNTVSATINYLRAGKDTEKLVIEADVVKCGRTLAVVDAKVMDDKGELLVTTTMTFMIFRS